MSDPSLGFRKLPPDRTPADMEKDQPSTDEIERNSRAMPRVPEMVNREDGDMARGKVQKKDGGFSGDTSMNPREEPWMNSGGTEPSERPKSPPKSYKEAVKPNNPREDEGDNEWMYDDWDGSLDFNNTEEVKRGVVVEETEQGIHITFSDDEKRRLNKKWQTTLIIKLLGGSLGYMHFRRRLQNLWGIQGKMDLSAIGNGYYLASFYSKDDYYFALEGGPWIIQNHYLTVQTWKSNFNPWNEQIRKLAVWVRLPGLPVDYYDRKFFYHLGNRIGKAIKIDEMTLHRSRTMYARMCVEIDLSAPLLPAYNVDGNALKIEYEGLHFICFHCGRVGHTLDNCPTRQAHATTPENGVQTGTNQETEESARKEETGGTPEKFGEWMKVKDARKGKRGSSYTGTSGQSQHRESKTDKGWTGSSRYEVLEVEDSTMEVENEGIKDKQALKDITNQPVGQRGKRGEQGVKELKTQAKQKSRVSEEKKSNRGEGRQMEKLNTSRINGSVSDNLNRIRRGDKASEVGQETGKIEAQEKEFSMNLAQEGKLSFEGHEKHQELLSKNHDRVRTQQQPEPGENMIIIDESKPPDPGNDNEFMDASDVEELLGLGDSSDMCDQVQAKDARDDRVPM